MARVKIGIVSNILVMETGSMPGLYRAYVNQDYVDSLEKAGCVPLLLPVVKDLEMLEEQMEGMDGIVLSGGYDINPLLYGESPRPENGFVMDEVDRYYLAAVQAAARLKKPVFGICKGMQAINVAFGGTMYQDLPSQMPGSYQHTQKAPRGNAVHEVSVAADSFIGRVMGEKTLVNSHHHQAVKDIAQGFKVTAKAGDGVVECIEREEGSFMCGVQWHPEMMICFGDPLMLELMKEFAEICRK